MALSVVRRKAVRPPVRTVAARVTFKGAKGYCDQCFACNATRLPEVPYMRDSKIGLCTNLCFCPKANAHYVGKQPSCCEREIGPQNVRAFLCMALAQILRRVHGRGQENLEARLSLELRSDEEAPSASGAGCPFHSDRGTEDVGANRRVARHWSRYWKAVFGSGLAHHFLRPPTVRWRAAARGSQRPTTMFRST